MRCQSASRSAGSWPITSGSTVRSASPAERSKPCEVIIAAPGTDGSFIGAGLLGNGKRNAMANAGGDAEQHAAAVDAKEAP